MKLKIKRPGPQIRSRRFKRFVDLGRKDLEAYLRLAPYADDAAEIREQAVSLKKLRTQIHWGVPTSLMTSVETRFNSLTILSPNLD